MAFSPYLPSDPESYTLPEDYEEGEYGPGGPGQTYYAKRNPYRGNQRKLQATIAFLSKLMQARQALTAGGAFKMPPNVDTDGDGVPDTYNPNIIMNFSGDFEEGLKEGVENTAGISIAAGMAKKLGIDAVSNTLLSEVAKNVFIPNPVIAAIVMIGTVLFNMGKDRVPFSVRNIGALAGRSDNTGKTARKLIEAGFDPVYSIHSILGDTVRTAQDYYEFRDKYFVGDFETATFRKDLGLDDENFYPLEEPEYEMLGDLKIYKGDNEELNLAIAEASDYVQELLDEGYSELRIMEELEIEVDAKHKNYFERADLTKLDEAREAGDEEAYMRLLGGMSAEVGELADQRTYEIAAGILTDEETREILKKRSRYETITQ